MQETGVQFLGWEDPLEKEMAIHSSLVSNNSTHYPLSDAEAEAAVLRPPDAKSQLTGKAPDAGED